MKHNIVRKFALIALILLGISITFTCKYFEFDGNTSGLISRPNVRSVGSGIVITLPISSSDTEYINIYRLDTASDEEINIGILFTKYQSEKDTVYLFEDSYVEKNHTYKYRARLFETDDGYFWTDYSDEVKAVNGLSELVGYKVLAAGPDEGKITFKEESRKFILSDGPSHDKIVPSTEGNFDAEFTPALVVEIVETKQRSIFPIEGTSVDMHFQELLPDNFYNTDIKFLGIAGIKREYALDKDENPTDKIKSAVFSSISELPLFIEDSAGNVTEDDDKTIIVMSSFAAQGLDAGF
ncbi:MAG: hypothetical protein MJ162_04550 [Treponema sp.]|nr:hypothetical protein [Treponema sp.]